jgi:hypothetical protein
MMKIPVRRILRSSSATAGLTIASHFCLRIGGAHAFVDNIACLQHNHNSVTALMMSSLVENETSAFDDRFDVLLPFEKSPHNSAIIVIPKEESPVFDRSTFRDRLKDTITALRELKKTSVWIEVPMSKASLIEETEDLNFQFHHASGNTAKLNLWLAEDKESKVPEFATQ